MDVKIITNNDRFDDKILTLSDRELYQAIGQINESVDELLYKIAAAIKNMRSADGEVIDRNIASQYSSLVHNFNTHSEQKIDSPKSKSEMKGSKSDNRTFRLTKESSMPQVSSSRGHRRRNFVEMSIRSKSSAELG